MKNVILNIIRSGTKESSKRFISIVSTGLLCYVVIRYTDKENAIQMAWALITFIGSLVGITITGDYLSRKQQQDEKIT